MMTKLMNIALAAVLVLFLTGCGGGSEATEDRNWLSTYTPFQGTGCGGGSEATEEVQATTNSEPETIESVQDDTAENTDDGGFTVESEQVCRVNMETIAMFLMNESQMSGTCPATLEELKSLSPAYEAIELNCCGEPYICETEGGSFTVTCPNGHGEVSDGETSWQW